MNQFSQWMNDFWKSLRNVRYTFALGNTKGVDETFSLSNQVCDNHWIDETSVHTIIYIIWSGTVLSILFPRSQLVSKRVSNSFFNMSSLPIHLRKRQYPFAKIQKKIKPQNFFSTFWENYLSPHFPNRHVWDISMMIFHEQNMYFSLPITMFSK